MSARRQIIAALSEDRGGIATLYDVAGAQQLADAHQAEVRREDAALIENAACDADWSATPAYCQGLRAGAELLLAKTTEKATPLTVYRASHDSIVMGLYTTAAAARAHCEAEVRREWSTRVTDLKLWWREDEDTVDQPEDGEQELIESTAPHYSRPTGYLVTPLEVASAYDEEAGE